MGKSGLPGLGFNPSLCRFNFKTVSVCGNFIFVASCALHRISFCYENTPLGPFYSWKRNQHPVFRAVIFKTALKCYSCPRMKFFCFYSAGGEGSGAGEERRGEQAASGVGSLGLERMWRSFHLGTERNPWEL